MTDKEHIAKWLKGKLAELCNEIQCEVSELPKDVIEGKILAFKEILSYMKSLQEEPKPLFNVGDTIRNKQWKTATHKIVSMDDKAYYLENEGKVEIAHQELWEVVGEPVSDELEEVAMQYRTDEFPSLCNGCKHIPIDAFKAGAKWQKNQTRKDAYKGYVSYIRDDNEAVIYLKDSCITMPSYFPKSNLKDGDNVRILVIKDELNYEQKRRNRKSSLV